MMRIFFLLFRLFFIMATNAFAQQSSYNNNHIIDIIAASGHRDIGVFTRNDTLLVAYQPIGFRDEYTAFRDVVNRVKAYLDSTNTGDIHHIECIQTAWGISLIDAMIDRNTDEITFSRKYTSQLKRKGMHEKYPARPVLLQFDIPLKVNFGNYGDPFVFRTGIRPNVQIRVKQGLVVYGQGDLYLHNEYDPHMWYNFVNAGILYMQPLNRNTISITNVGAFQKELYGIDEMVRLSLHKDQLSLWMHCGMYGTLIYKNNHFTYDDLNHYLLVLRTAWSYAPFDCTVSLKGGRFVYGDVGFGGEISRVFSELEIRLSAVFSESNTIASISFRVPLIPQKRKTYSKYGIAICKDFKFSYTLSSPQKDIDPRSSVQRASEPELGISLSEIERLTRPTHFTNRLNHYSFIK